MPSLVKLYDEFKNSGFVVLAIDIREKRKIAKNMQRRKNCPFLYFWILMGRSPTIMRSERIPLIF